MILTESDISRFWEKVYKAPTGCWSWQYSVNSYGYGQFWINALKRNEVAHRVSWFIYFGPIPNDKCVLHKCANACCVNPEHLYLGTQKDNARDTVAHGRFANQWPKITRSKADLVIVLKSEGLSNREIASACFIDRKTVSKVLQGEYEVGRLVPTGIDSQRA